VNILPGVQSVYRWQGAVETAAEVLLVIKTSAARSPQVQATIAALHSYAVPEALILPVDGGSKAYLEWLKTSLE
jgi:periplasmic divalent cation tolerance protein